MSTILIEREKYVKLKKKKKEDAISNEIDGKKKLYDLTYGDNKFRMYKEKKIYTNLVILSHIL